MPPYTDQCDGDVRRVQCVGGPVPPYTDRCDGDVRRVQCGSYSVQRR